jgi:biopolymer transport protein ExbD
MRIIRRFLGLTLVLLMLFMLASLAWAQDNTVQVELTEFTIDMPASLPAGTTIFEVTNAGTMEHNFEIVGQGLEEVFETNLQPGETRTLQVDLQPGTYEVYCPVSNHREEGMLVELTVTEPEAEETTTTETVTETTQITATATTEIMTETTEVTATAIAETTTSAPTAALTETTAITTTVSETMTLPETGGVALPGVEIFVLGIGALLFLGGVSLALIHRAR